MAKRRQKKLELAEKVRTHLSAGFGPLLLTEAEWRLIVAALITASMSEVKR